MSISFFGSQNSWLTRAVLIVIAVTFIFGFGYFGVINLTSTGISTGTAAEVNGERIPLVQFYNVRQNLYRQFGEGLENIPPEAMEFFNYRALQQLVEAKLLAQKAQKLGFIVSDRELSESIRTNPSFQVDGKFIGLDNYRNAIRQALNMSVGDFEKGYREELLVQKIVGLINNSAKLTDDELYNLYKVQNENVSLYYISFSPDDFSNSASITEDEIKNFYDQNRGDFLSKERRKVKFLKVNKADFEKGISVSEEDIISYYNTYNDEFKDESGNTKPLEDVRGDINEKLLNKIAGQVYDNFLNTVTRSENVGPLDKLIADNSLGEAEESDYFTADDIVEALPAQVKNKAFTLGIGEVSAYNYRGELWVYEVSDIVPQGQKTLDESREEVKAAIQRNKGQEAAKIAAEETFNKIKTKKSFPGAAKSLGLKLNESESFNRSNPPEPLNIEDLKLDAFLLETSDPNGKKVYESDESYYIISLKEKSNASREKFEQDKEKIKSNQVARLQSELLSEWIKQLRSESKIVPNPNLFASSN